MEKKETCPYLGIKTDENTSHLYPSRANYCHRVSPPGRIGRGWQSQWCLAGQYKDCLVFSQDGLSKLPAGIGVAKHKRRRKKPWRIVILGLILCGLGAIFLLWNGDLFQASEVVGNETLASMAYFATPTSLHSPSSTLSNTSPPALTSTVIHTPSSTPTPISTYTPSITSTPYPTSGPNLTTPFGPDHSYLIHSVGQGESFASLENKYKTTREVIKAINSLSESDILSTGKRLVIMPGQGNPVNLPIFKIVFLDQQMDVIEIAGMYSSSVEDIRYYNALGQSDESIPSGRWLIIPVE